MTADPPPEPTPPPLSVPLEFARFRCPHCGRARRFETHRALSDNSRPLGCLCGKALGVVVVDAAGMTLLRLAMVG